MAKTAAKKAKTTDKSKLGRRSIKKLGRDKRNAKIATDKEFAKKFFEAKSKRNSDKKVAFRKKKNKK